MMPNMKIKTPVMKVEIYGDISTFNLYSSRSTLPINIIIDTEDVIRMSKKSWYYVETGNYKIPRIRNNNQVCLEHFILNLPPYKRIIHKNDNPFDFRKSNLDVLE